MATRCVLELQVSWASMELMTLCCQLCCCFCFCCCLYPPSLRSSTWVPCSCDSSSAFPQIKRITKSSATMCLQSILLLRTQTLHVPFETFFQVLDPSLILLHMLDNPQASNKRRKPRIYPCTHLSNYRVSSGIKY